MEHVSDKPHDQTPKQSPVQYFLPGRLVLHVEHPAGLTQADLAKEIAGFLSMQSKEQDVQSKEQHVQSKEQQWKEQIEPPKLESILTFPPEKGQNLVFSIVPTQLRNAKASQEDLVNLLKTIYGELKNGPLVVANNISLKTVSPNWLIGSATHGIGTSGPGAWPVEAHPPEGESWRFRPQSPQDPVAKLLSTDGQGAGVHVAILDTAPSVLDLKEAHAARPDHRLVKTLLGPAGKLHVHSGIYADLDLMDYTVTGHRYLMPDHGLFIAGIIHSIASEATLHLFKVFSPYGVSSIETIAQGLLQVLQNPDIGRPLIINCSFGLSIPLQGHLDPDFPPKLLELLREPLILERMTISMLEIFDRFAKQDGVIVVAAAGNDAQHNNSNTDGSRPFARYPAAFENVLGVGALPKRFPMTHGPHMAATYSNLSDRPPNTGYMTFGGEPGPEQGVLGIYISEFPVYDEPDGCLACLWRILNRGAARRPGHLPQDIRALTPDRIRYEPNTTGWAWWAGTSFATAIISGILANWCSLPQDARAARADDTDITLTNAKRALSERSQGTTPQNEAVILVTQ